MNELLMTRQDDICADARLLLHAHVAPCRQQSINKREEAWGSARFEPGASYTMERANRFTIEMADGTFQRSCVVACQQSAAVCAAARMYE